MNDTWQDGDLVVDRHSPRQIGNISAESEYPSYTYVYYPDKSARYLAYDVDLLNLSALEREVQRISRLLTFGSLASLLKRRGGL